MGRGLARGGEARSGGKIGEVIPVRLLTCNLLIVREKFEASQSRGLNVLLSAQGFHK